MGLISMLLVVLMSFYFQVTKSQEEVTAIREQNFRTLYLQHRLGHAIPRSVLNSGTSKYWFYTSTDEEHQSLVFVYDNGVDGNPLFASRVLGKLYLDNQGNLSLLTWPLPKKNFNQSPPMRKEVLYTNVEKIGFEFFQPPTGEQEKGWRTSWNLDAPELPAIVNIVIKEVGIEKPIILSYVLPKSKQTILYNEGE